jgi:hypothetical protein
MEKYNTIVFTGVDDEYRYVRKYDLLKKTTENLMMSHIMYDKEICNLQYVPDEDRDAFYYCKVFKVSKPVFEIHKYRIDTDINSMISVRYYAQNRLYINDGNIYFDGRRITNENSDWEAIYMEKYNVIVFIRNNEIWKYDVRTGTKKLIVDEGSVSNLLYVPNINQDVFYCGKYGTSEPFTLIYNMRTSTSSSVFGDILKVIDKGKYKDCFVVEYSQYVGAFCVSRLLTRLIFDKDFNEIGCIYVQDNYTERGVIDVHSADYDKVTFINRLGCNELLDSAYIHAKTGLRYMREFQRTKSIRLKNEIIRLRLKCEEYLSHLVEDFEDFPEELRGKAEIVYDFLGKEY